MTIASTSSTFCTEATPAPSAAIASSMSSTASLSSRSSARAQMPLVSRSRPRSRMMSKRSVLSPFFWRSRARISIEPRPA